jgi:flagellar biogenesis protein FliO
MSSALATDIPSVVFIIAIVFFIAWMIAKSPRHLT